MTKRATSLSCRLSRSRRALAAFLLLGGAAVTGISSPAAAHDHAVTSFAIAERAGESLPPLASNPAAQADDWLLNDWLAEDCGNRTCVEALSSLPNTSSTTRSLQVNERSGGPVTGTASSEQAGAAGSVVKPSWLADWLAWGAGAKQWVSPLLPPADWVTQLNPSPTSGESVNERSLARELSDLTCEEPVDIYRPVRADFLVDNAPDLASDAAAAQSEPVAEAPPAQQHHAAERSMSSAPSDPPATAPPRLSRQVLLGSSPIIATLPDSYWSYDLSPEDVIAMRMYPIDQPAPNYSSARRTSVYRSVAAPDGDAWRVVTEPAVMVSTAELARDGSSPVAKPEASSAAVAPADQAEIDERLAKLANAVVEAVQPRSEVRDQLRPQQLGSRLGQWSQSRNNLAEMLVANLAAPSAPNVAPDLGGEPAMQVAQAELQAPQQADALAAVLLLPTGEGRVLQVELACQAAIEVVMAQAARSTQAEPSDALTPAPVDPLVQATAIATACDQAAATLEKLAMAIRRAGDSVIRQAQIQGGSSTLLR